MDDDIVAYYCSPDGTEIAVRQVSEGEWRLIYNGETIRYGDRDAAVVRFFALVRAPG